MQHILAAHLYNLFATYPPFDTAIYSTWLFHSVTNVYTYNIFHFFCEAYFTHSQSQLDVVTCICHNSMLLLVSPALVSYSSTLHCVQQSLIFLHVHSCNFSCMFFFTIQETNKQIPLLQQTQCYRIVKRLFFIYMNLKIIMYLCFHIPGDNFCVLVTTPLHLVYQDINDSLIKHQTVIMVTAH